MLVYVVDRPLKYIDPKIDILEIRADLYSDIIPKKHPWILTIRRKKDKGGFNLSEKERFKLFEKLLKFKPDYLDLELDVPISFAKKIKKNYPALKLIRSYHDFKKTPMHLEAQLSLMLHPLFDIYKISTFANSSLDSLRMMHFVQTSKYRVSGICMGKKGMITRLGPLFNNAMDYTSNYPLHGQISLKDLFEVYRYPFLTKDTPIYGLIGDPIDHSIGSLFHNRFFEMSKQKAVYVKIPLEEKELSEFFCMIKNFSFLGFSVTTPLKEKVREFCEPLEGPVNTLVWRQKKWKGRNTDGKGALLALENSLNLKDKKILILGAGSTARAIVSQAVKRGFYLTILNRDLDKARKKISEKIDILSSLSYSDCFDLLINTTSCEIEDHSCFSAVSWLKKHIAVMDVSYKIQKTTLIKIAEEKYCQTITGFMMFFYQALLQQQIWQRKSMKKDWIIQFKKIWKRDLHQYGYEL